MAGLVQRIRRVLENKPLDATLITISGQDVTVIFRRHAQARRLVLRLAPEGDAVVTVPHGVSRAQAIEFVLRSTGWLERRLARTPDPIRLLPGHLIPLRGESYEIRRLESLRGTVACDPVERLIYVPGDPAHGPRRLLDWLKAAARADLEAASRRYAVAMGVDFSRITLRDQKSRWGSCSHSGALSYSWRLILAPAHVLDYVAAHEVAHIRHMDHGPRFWRLVLTHCADAQKAKSWLKTHGQSVHRIIT